MKQLAFALFIAAAPALAGDLRLFNPSAQPVAVRIACEGGSTSAIVAPHAVVDAGDECSAFPATPLVILRSGTNDGIEWQQLEAAPNDACPPAAPLFLPLNGCRFGSAVASVAAVDGASYSWSIDGGSILGGEGTDRILIALEGGDVAHVTAGISKGGCTTMATGVMSLHDALKIESLDAGSGNAGEPRTVTWSYTNGESAAQVLSGTDFPNPVALSPDVRSYTFTPVGGGEKEIVLQASATPAGRSRAATHGGGAASSCGTAHASTSFSVDCTRPQTDIVVPGMASLGKPFTARVTLAPGSTASWTVSNGTPPTAAGESVAITPLNYDPVDIAVTVTSSAGCSASATARVTVDTAGFCDNPTVNVVVARNDCSGAVVSATFTGKPPFRGMWSDGTPFISNGYHFDRAVISGTATYSVATFSDAFCAGPASNSVTLTVKKPTGTLSGNGNCAGSATIAATFTGAPPFSGTWSDGLTFSTASTTLQRSVTSGGALSMTFGDANCSGLQSNTVNFVQPGTATLSFQGGTPACVKLPGTSLQVDIAGGTPPYKVTWDDGYVQQATTTPVVRPAYNYRGTYAITRAQDASCDLALKNAIVSAPAARIPYFYFAVYDESTLCTDTEYVAHMTSPPDPGSVVTWSVTNGTIVSGQGAQDLHFKPVGSGTVTVTAVLSVSGCTNTYDKSATIRTQVQPATIALSPSTTKVGQPVTITVTGYTQWYTVTASVRQDLLVYVSGSGTTSTVWKYTPASAGTVTILVHETGNCDSTFVDSTATITVTS